ncbi:MAG: hypothetical protein HUK20_01190 [Fibrobacter sp.]|nr:hypothetical protein [Fibrobacter sp.]
MDNKFFLKPVEGIEVYLPSRGRNVKHDGEEIFVDAYIARRISDGELVSVESPKENNNKKTKTEEH